MAVIENSDNKELKLTQYDIDFIINITKFIVKRYNDLNKHDQYALFLDLCNIPLLKLEFFEYRDKALVALRKGFDHDNIKMEYHVSTDLPDTHLKMTQGVKRTFFYWENRFNEESAKKYPNDYLLKMYTQLMLETSERAGKLLLGTPVMVWVQRRARLFDRSNKTVSIKDFGAELSTNKYNTDTSKIDTLNNGSTAPSIPNNITKSEQQRGQDGGSIRLSGSGKGQYLQDSSSSSVNEGGTEGIQGADDTRETEELF